MTVQDLSRIRGERKEQASSGSLPLTMNAVTKRYGRRNVLDGFSLRVQRGEIVSLLGPNGAGKSTTLALALGFLKPDAGTVQVAGIDATADPHGARRRVAYIPENVQLYPSLSGLENLQYFSALSGQRLPEAELQQALLRAGLPEGSHRRRLGEYSKGMRQKAGIAIAMVRKCDLLLLDEPTSGLDPIASAEFHHSLLSAASDGAGVLMATHDLEHVLKISHRVLILRAGRLAVSIGRAEFTGVNLEAVYAEAMAQARTDVVTDA